MRAFPLAILLTWNVGRLYLGGGVESRLSEDHLEHVAKVVRDSGADLACLQETTGPDQVERLLKLLPGWSGKAWEDRFDRRAALLVKGEARWGRIESAVGRWWPTAEWAGLRAACVHLSPFDGDARLAQVDQLKAWSAERADRSIVLGDFNFAPTSLAYTNMTQRFTDATSNVAWTTVTRNKLDYVFLFPATGWDAKAQGVIGKRKPMMDHMPVVVTLDPAVDAPGRMR